MHGHVLEVVKRLLELVNNRINRVMHVGKYIMGGGLRKSHARNNRIIPLTSLFFSVFLLLNR
jgi:hypothetical protein